MNSTNTVVANAMAARNAAPKGLTPTTKLRLKEDFSDEYGSYRKGDVFPMYAMGGINPRFGTMMVPGRGVTLQIPWEKLEVVNAKRVARNAMQNAGSYVQECNKFIPEANAMIREWDAFYKKMTAKRKWYDSKMTELRDGFYRIDKGDPDYDKASAAYDALRDVSRSAEVVHLFYSV